MTGEFAQRSAATKVLDVLSALTSSAGPHRIVDLSHDTGLAKATVYRMLQNLVETGFVVSTPHGLYSIGPQFLGVAAAALSDSPERPIVRSALERLRTATGLSAHYAQSFGDRVVVVDTVESGDPYGLPARPGRTSNIRSTAFGIAIATANVTHEATQGSAAVEAVAGTPADTPSSAATTFDDPETPGLRSIAAPLFGARFGVIGAIGVSGTTFTLSASAVEHMAQLVARAASELSAVLIAKGISVPGGDSHRAAERTVGPSDAQQPGGRRLA